MTDSNGLEKRSCSDSEERYRLLIRKIRTAIVLHDAQGRILDSNPMAQELLGLSAEQLAGRALIDTEWHFLREDGSVLPVAEYPAHLVLSSRQPLRDFVTGISRPDRDAVMWVLVNGEPEYNDAGEITMVIVSFVDITERKRVEEELRTSEAKYRIVADNTYDWEFWTDANDHYVYISQSCQRITGFPAVAFKANPALLDSIIHPDDWQSYRNHLMETKAGQSLGSVEFRILDKDGRVRWIEHFCQPVFDEAGTWLGTRGNNREVTKRKEAEHLKQLTTSILAILNESTDLTASINRVLEIIKQGIEFDAIGIRLQSGADFPYFASAGFPDDFLIAENSLVVPDRKGGLCRDCDGNVCLECTCGLVISGKSDPANPLFTPGGSCWTNNSLPLLDLPLDQDPRLNPRNLCIHKNFFSVALIPIRANHKIIGLLQLNDHKKDRLSSDMVACFEDVCTSIGLSLMKKQAEEALKTSEARFRRLAENAKDVIFRMALPDGVYEYISPAAMEQFGHAPEEFYAAPDLLRKLIHPDWHAYFDTEWEKLLHGEMPPDYEYQIVHKSGKVRWINQRNILDRDEEDRIVAIEGIVTDVTERKQVEEELRELNAELEHRVTERTKELERRNHELEQMNKAFVGRELKMVELKERIRDLENNPEKRGDQNARQ
ncbi:MAG: PAS domain S-box protein [Desulfuromonadaceae bacterium]|nr:PAS domain S-box protein [Desulfuromonadaceae bacterium]